MKKLVILLLPMLAEANSLTFTVKTTGDFCYEEDFKSVIASVESSLQHNANLVFHDRQALKNRRLDTHTGPVLCNSKLILCANNSAFWKDGRAIEFLAAEAVL